MYQATLFPQFVNSVEFATLSWLSTWPSVNRELSSAVYFPRRVIFFLTQRFTCTPIQNPHPEQLTPYWWALRRAKQLSMVETQLCWSSISVVLMSCKVKSFYVVRSALLLCLSLQIFAGTLPEVFTIYTRRPSFLFNRVYVAVIWVVTKERCVITQMHRRRHWSDFPKTRNCGTGACAIF